MRENPSRNVWRSIFIGLFTTAAFFLRLQGSSEVGYNMDEVEKALAAASYLEGDFFVDMEHPMLFKILLAASFLVFGAGEATARFLTAVLGAATVPLVYALGRRLFNPTVGIVSAALFTVSPFAVAVNHTVKEETLFMIFWLLALQALLGAEEKGSRSLRLAAAALGLAWASKNNAPFLMIIMAGALLFFRDLRTAMAFRLSGRTGVLLLGVCGFAYLLFNPLVLTPEYWSFIAGSGGGPEGIDRYRAVEPQRLRTAFGLNLNLFYHSYLLKKPLLIVTACGIYGALRGIGLRARSVLFLLFWIGTILLYLVLPSLQMRYLYMLWPAFLMLAAWGLTEAASGLARPFGGAAKLSTMLVIAGTFTVLAAGAAADMRLAPHQTLYANSLAGWGRKAPVLLVTNDLYATGTEKKLIDHLNRTARRGSTIGAVLPLRPTAPLNVYEYYGREDFAYVDINLLHGAEALGGSKEVNYFIVSRYKDHHLSPELRSVLAEHYREVYSVRLHGILAGRIYERSPA